MRGINAWLDIIRREAQAVAFAMHQKSTLIATSYDPGKHAIKGMIVPHGVESGWVPIGVAHSGNGYGIAVGPKVGSADKLDGDAFDIKFAFGDPNRPMATLRRHSIPDKPPRVESGEMLLQQEGSEQGKNNKLFFAKDKSITMNHESGNKLAFNADKTITMTHFAKGGTLSFDDSGKIAVDTKDQDVAINAGAGSHTLTAKNIKLSGAVAVDGSLTSIGVIAGHGVKYGKSVQTVA